MKISDPITVACLMAASASLAITMSAAHAEVFTLDEAFGVSHPEQVVDFDLTSPVDFATTSLLDATGRSVPYQLLEDGRKLAVRTDLPAGAHRAWTLVRGRRFAWRDADLVSVREEAGYYEVGNGVTGVRIVRSQPGGADIAAPIQGIRMRDGSWSALGPNVLQARVIRLVDFAVRFVERGPLKVVIEVAYRFDRPEYRDGTVQVMPSGPAFYVSTITVEAGQPSILVEENTDIDLSYSLDLHGAVQPTRARYRGLRSTAPEFGYAPDGREFTRSGSLSLDVQVDLSYDRPMASQYISTRDSWRWISAWDPWALNTGWYWQMFDGEAAEGANLIGIFAGRASRAIGAGFSGVGIFTKPGTQGARQAGITIQSYRRHADARIFPQTRFQWGLFVGTKADLRAPDQVQPVNVQMNLHGGFNLSKVHRYALRWPQRDAYRGLYMDKGTVDRVVARIRGDKEYYRWLYGAETTSRPLIDMWSDASGNNVRAVATSLATLARTILSSYVNGEGIYAFDFQYWHGGVEMMRKGLWIDQVLASDALSAAQREQVEAVGLLFANILWDDDFVPMFQGHGLSLGNANMPVQQQGYRDFYALLLGAHPEMRERAAGARLRTLATLRSIVNDYGAEIGAPHYMGPSFVPTLNTLLQIKLSGETDPFVTEPKLTRFSEFYMNLLTPPEPRVGGRRALISLGDSSTEVSDVLGTLGTAFRGVDDPLSARLMGAWLASGRPHSGFFGTTLLTIDDSLPVADPKLSDAAFPGYYTVLRHAWGTERETAIWVVNGDFYSDHRHDDHGSVVLYALGAPVAVDWGSLYLPRAAGGYFHSAVVTEDSLSQAWDQDSPPLDTGGGWRDSEVTAFETRSEGAYVRSRFQRPGITWTRTVTSVRTDEDHPIIVIRDSFEGSRAEVPKIVSLNLMARGEVETPRGNLAPVPRRHPVADHDPANPAHELPSATPPMDIDPGAHRFRFSGRYGVDFDVYVVGAHKQQALVGSWAVTPWGGQMTDREERQHILRVRGPGSFATVILPRRGSKPASNTVVALHGDAITVTTDQGTVRVDAVGTWTSTRP